MMELNLIKDKKKCNVDLSALHPRLASWMNQKSEWRKTDLKRVMRTHSRVTSSAKDRPRTSVEGDAWFLTLRISSPSMIIPIDGVLL